MTGTLLTTVEVAERLGLSSAAVAQAVRTGALQPAARTADDFLFSERSVAQFAERRASVAASRLESPPAATKEEWRGDVDRLNSWLSDLTDALPNKTIVVPKKQPDVSFPPEPEQAPPAAQEDESLPPGAGEGPPAKPAAEG